MTENDHTSGDLPPWRPDDTLRRARAAAISVERLTAVPGTPHRDRALREQAQVLALNFGVLDEWLARGGELPVSWERG